MATRRSSLQELQAQEERSRQALLKKRTAFAKVHSQLRDAEVKAHTRQRAIVGNLVLETCLKELSLLALQEALQALARCVQDAAGYQAFLGKYGNQSARESSHGASGVSVPLTQQTGKNGHAES